MALSDKEISALYFEALGSQHLREQDRKTVTRFAHAVESEVRKQDEALIQQLAEAILEVYPHLSGLAVASDEALKLFQQQVSAIAAARKRLEGKP